jgi:hypothetical protein
MSGMAGLNIGALPMNPALVAAALNQASWGLIGGLQVSFRVNKFRYDASPCVLFFSDLDSGINGNSSYRAPVLLIIRITGYRYFVAGYLAFF